MLHPPNLVAAFGLAKLQEEYILTSRRPLRSSSTSFSFGRQQSWGQSSSSPASFVPQTSGPLALPAKTPSGMPIQRISPAQMKEKHDKGLCYYCDDKWLPGHKCKSPRLYLMSGLELPLNEPSEEVFMIPRTSLIPFLHLMSWNERIWRFPSVPFLVHSAPTPCVYSGFYSLTK
jgi:hypothetical protein